VKQVWRLIPWLEFPGNVQMAIDNWLLEQHLLGKQPPTLRFYNWSPAAISLGYHQYKYPEHWQHLIWEGEKLDIVRRPSGGRAVLHQGDLTYAVVTSGLGESRLQAYSQICEFLIQGWRSLGVELDYGKSGRGYIHNPNCFGTATNADLILANGKKLIGSAQLRRGEAILQHGSMQLNPDADLFQQVFGLELERTTSLSFNLTREEIMTALITAAGEHFQVEIEAKPLTEDEWQVIQNI
jgi:lipoate-protein ligase A